MVTIARTVVLLVILSSSLFAGEPGTPFHSAYEARRAFLGIGTVPAPPDTFPAPELVFREQEVKKSIGLAIVYSLLLPGMGELYAGSFQTGRYFLAAEGALWITLAGFDIYGNALRDDSREFAAAHAGEEARGL